MAKAKKAPKSSSGPAPDSNTGLIVTLVFFVLATLTLGVFTYMGYSGQAELVEKEKKAQADAKAAKKSLEEETVKRLVLAVGTGNEQPGDQQKLNGLKGSHKPIFDAATAAMRELPAWNATLDRPADTYQDLIAKLRKERDTALNEKKVAENNLAEARATHDSERKGLNERLTKANDDLKAAQAKALEDLNKSRADYIALIDKIDKELSEGLKNEKQNRADDNAAAERDKKKLGESINGLRTQLDVARSKIAPPNSLASESPKGKILKVDRAARTVFVNLGSADYLKPQVTFSIWGPETTAKGAANQEPKGQIEIVNVVEPHLSIARIVSTNSEIRDPLLPGDLLFNPSWNSTQREHIALAGIFDLDGDGRDDTPELIRNLERQGIVVDAWLDLKDRTIKGPGITERTTYLVLGESPKLAESLARQRAALGDNAIVQAYEQVSGKIATMQEAAKEKGVQPVAYRRYLTLVGYQLPKLTKPLDMTASSYLRPGTAAAGDAPAKEGEEKPK
ncbi:MAG: hypothetical protein K1X57_15285 [Gemmataceae bacterium]|nr:hypothetical protein [Gemmataceae bacterium]